jgi:hypothetical protein
VVGADAHGTVELLALEDQGGEHLLDVGALSLKLLLITALHTNPK